MNYYEAFEKFIQGQKVVKPVSYGYDDLKERFVIGYGFKFENGYSYISHGGGASGYDAQSQHILDPENNVVASENWTE